MQQARLEPGRPDSGLKPLRRIKIALIDTGIVGVEDRKNNIRDFGPGQIKDGISFVHGKDGEIETPWFLPSNEHGPQMAGIICSIDPYCELYPAKVANDRSVEAVESIVKVSTARIFLQRIPTNRKMRLSTGQFGKKLI